MQSIFNFCCVSRSQEAKQTPGESDLLQLQETSAIAPVRKPLARPHTSQILQRFRLIEDEIMLGLVQVDLVQLCDSLISGSIQEVKRVSSKSSHSSKKDLVRIIPRDRVAKIFKSTPKINMTPILAKCLQLDYFFAQGGKDYYDFEKLVIFCLLYSKSAPVLLKNELLYEVMSNSQTQRIEYASKSIPRLLEILVIITCFLIAHFLQNNIDVLSSADEQEDFEELFNIFIQSEQNENLGDFTLYTRNNCIFPLGSRGAGKSNTTNREAFGDTQKEQGYPLVQSDILREMFVKYVYANDFKTSESLLRATGRTNLKSDSQNLGTTGRTELKNNSHHVPKLLNVMSESLISSNSVNSQSKRNKGPLVKDDGEKSVEGYEKQTQLIQFNKKKKSSRREVSEDSKADNDYFEVPVAAKTKKMLQQSQVYIIEPIMEQDEDDFKLKRKQRSKKNHASSEEAIVKVSKQGSKSYLSEKSPLVLESQKEQIVMLPKQKQENITVNDQSQPVLKEQRMQKQKKEKSRPKQEPMVDSDSFIQLGSQSSSKKIKKMKKEKGNASPGLVPEQHKARQSVVSIMRGTRATIQKRVADVESHLCEIYGEQFYQMVYLLLLENQADFEEDNQLSDVDHKSNKQLLKSRADRFRRNQKVVTNQKGYQLSFPNYKSFNPHIREIFELFRQTVKAEDIVALHNGTLFNENFLNLYFKILDKMNSVLLTAQTYAQQTPTPEPDTVTCEKVMYCSSNYIRRLRKTPQLSQIKQNPQLSQEVSKVYDFDVVIVPFFFDEHPGSYRLTDKSTPTPGQFDGSGTVIVAIQTKNLKIDLFDRGTRQTVLSDVSETKNQVISEEILNLLESAAILSTKSGVKFNEDEVDGGVESVCVECEEDYLIAMIYIAECFTFNRAIDLETFNLERERNKIVDVLLSLLRFE